MAARLPLALVLFVVASTGALARPSDDAVRIDGRACRINRSVDRLIVMTDSGDRLRVVAESTHFTFGRERFEPADLRPGDPVRVAGRLKKNDLVEADTVRVRPDVADAVWEALFPSKSPSLVGRFAVREAQSEFFSLNLPGMNYIRVDAKGAYGGSGRVRVSSLKSGDLLEVRGEWVKDDLFRASNIDIQTDNEPASCKVKLSADKAAAEQLFLGQ